MGQPAPLGVAAFGTPVPGDQANAVLSGVISGVGPSLPFAFRGPMDLSIYAVEIATLTTTAGSLDATASEALTGGPGASVNSVNVPPGTTFGTLAAGAGTLVVPPISLMGKIEPPKRLITDLISTVGLLGATVSGESFPVGGTVQQIIREAIAPTPNRPQGDRGIVLLSEVPVITQPYNVPLPFVFARTGNAILGGVDDAATFTGGDIEYVGSIQLERSFDGGFTWIVCNIGSTGALAQYNAGTPVSLTFGEPEKQVLYRLNCTAYTSGLIRYRISQTGGAAESLAIGPLSGG